MNIKRLIQRPKSHHEKTPSLMKNNKEISDSRSQHRPTNYLEQESDNDHDSFFDNFHQKFVVLETKVKPKTISNKIKKPLPYQVKTKKQNNPYLIKRKTDNQGKSFSCLNQKVKPIKVKPSKSVLKKNNKTCQSERNLLINCENKVLNTKKRSEKKSEAQSKRPSSNKNSKRCTTKKKILGTGSTATTTLGNSAINFKDEIHIASYLRLKIK